MPTWRSRYVPTPLGVIRATPPPTSTARATPGAETSFEPLRDEDDQPPPEATIVNSAIYAGGRKVSDAGSIAEAWRELHHPSHHDHGPRMAWIGICLLYTSPSPRDATLSRMPSSA